MLSGVFIMEDIILSYNQNVQVDNTIDYVVTEIFSGMQESFRAVPQDKFFKALALAVHNDGTPDYRADYPDAEALMGKIRWIP